MSRRGTIIHMEGKVFNDLTVIRRASRAPKSKLIYWECLCSCGATTTVRGDKLRAGLAKNCKHGGWTQNRPARSHLAITVEYRSEYSSWLNMRVRCARPKCRMYPHYGGRGIRICPQWKNSFKNFLRDMGAKPTPKHTIERKDVNGDYEPKNCRWATMAEQAKNKRTSVYVTYHGRRMLLTELVAELGLRRSIVYARLKMGWPLDIALALPLYKRR